MKIVSAAAMREADRLTMEKYGMPGAVLMEKAGERAAGFILNRRPPVKRVVVVAGPGNNGGDGLVIARLLEKAGVVVTLWSTVQAGNYRGDAKINENYLLKLPFPVERFDDKRKLDNFRESLSRADLVVDALLGIGTDREISGMLAEIINAVNGCGKPVLSVDIPSGVHADSGAVMGCAVKARWTITCACPKLGLFFPPGCNQAGQIFVGEIGVPENLIDDQPVELNTVSRVRLALPERSFDSHKGSMGKAVIVAGSPGMTGAAILAAEAAQRSGAGLVYLAAPASVCPVLEAKTLEVIIIALPEKEPGIIDPSAADLIVERTRGCDALAVGPGLDPGENTTELLDKLIQLSPVPIVIDAGGLKALASQINMLRSAKYTPVVTPHPGEMGALIGKAAGDVQNSRLATAGEHAVLWNCIVLLKGANSIIALPDGRAFINPTGGPSLSTAGSGDLLTGTVVSMLAQGLSPENAAGSAAFIHGLAGDLLPPGRGYMARDILDRYKETFCRLECASHRVPENPFLTAIRPLSEEE
ncbi:MAG: NAD(P)H-hydrate dehydratase [Bacillota bacterium]|nr:NAD(P)H-hydrate dehydratase [Bacillota bacterium]